MNFEAPNFKKEEQKTETVTWSNPDGTIGSGTEQDRKDALENWDRD